MAAVQTTYASGISAAIAGLVANQELSNIVTRKVEDAGGIGFGKAVFQGTADNEITATPSATFVGVTVIDRTVENASTPDETPVDQDAAVCDFGIIYVTAGGTVTAGNPAAVAPDGDWEEVATANQTITGAVFVDSGVANGLVRVRIRRP